MQKGKYDYSQKDITYLPPHRQNCNGDRYIAANQRIYIRPKLGEAAIPLGDGPYAL